MAADRPVVISGECIYIKDNPPQDPFLLFREASDLAGDLFNGLIDPVDRGNEHVLSLPRRSDPLHGAHLFSSFD
jgi:hypothetical protein